MRKILVAILVIVFFSPAVQAETYRISGKATYADNSPVSLDYVYVECEQGEYDCYQYRGTKAMTDAYGSFTIKWLLVIDLVITTKPLRTKIVFGSIHTISKNAYGSYFHNTRTLQ